MGTLFINKSIYFINNNEIAKTLLGNMYKTFVVYLILLKVV